MFPPQLTYLAGVKFASQKEEERRGIQTGVNMRAFYSLSQKEPHLFLFFFFFNSENKLLSPSPVTMVTEPFCSE